MDKNIFIYWTGVEFSLIRILRDIMRRHSGNDRNYILHYIHDDNIHEYILDLPYNFDRLQPAHKADYIRMYVIYHYGGVWLDSDTLVMSDMSSIFDLLENYDGFFIKEDNKVLCNGVFGAKKNNPYIGSILNDIYDIIVNRTTIGWCDIGSRLLSKYDFKGFKILNGLDSVYPINWDKCVDEYINSEYNNHIYIERDFQPFIILVNSVYKKLRVYTEEEIMNLDIPLLYFIKKSIENEI